MNLLQACIDLLFPQNCIICDKNDMPLCIACSSSFEYNKNSNPNLPTFISPALCYSDANVKKCIWGLKYSNKKNLAPALAEQMSDILKATACELYELKGVRNILLIPIPLHPRRQREREYNQSELLANSLLALDTSVILKVEVNALVRKKFSLPNARTHSKQERILNTIGSFEVSKPEKVRGKYVILIDDVATTGTTLSEARKVLLAAGARHVEAVTLAH